MAILLSGPSLINGFFKQGPLAFLYITKPILKFGVAKTYLEDSKDVSFSTLLHHTDNTSTLIHTFSTEAEALAEFNSTIFIFDPRYYRVHVSFVDLIFCFLYLLLLVFHYFC